MALIKKKHEVKYLPCQMYAETVLEVQLMALITSGKAFEITKKKVKRST